MWAGRARPDFDEDTQRLFDRLIELIDTNSLEKVDGFELYPGRMITDPSNYAITLRDSLESQNAAARRAGDVAERLRLFISRVDG